MWNIWMGKSRKLGYDLRLQLWVIDKNSRNNIDYWILAKINITNFYFFSATKLQEDILTYWREHQGFNAVKLIKDPTLYNKTFDDNTVSGAYNLTINGNYGFLCDYARTLDQHAANLLCLSVGYSKAMEGNGTGWFHQGYFFRKFTESNVVFRSRFRVIRSAHSSCPCQMRFKCYINNRLHFRWLGKRLGG